MAEKSPEAKRRDALLKRFLTPQEGIAPLTSEERDELQTLIDNEMHGLTRAFLRESGQIGETPFDYNDYWRKSDYLVPADLYTAFLEFMRRARIMMKRRPARGKNRTLVGRAIPLATRTEGDSWHDVSAEAQPPAAGISAAAIDNDDDNGDDDGPRVPTLGPPAAPPPEMYEDKKALERRAADAVPPPLPSVDSSSGDSTTGDANNSGTDEIEVEIEVVSDQMTEEQTAEEAARGEENDMTEQEMHGATQAVDTGSMQQQPAAQPDKAATDEKASDPAAQPDKAATDEKASDPAAQPDKAAADEKASDPAAQPDKAAADEKAAAEEQKRLDKEATDKAAAEEQARLDKEAKRTHEWKAQKEKEAREAEEKRLRDKQAEKKRRETAAASAKSAVSNQGPTQGVAGNPPAATPPAQASAPANKKNRRWAWLIAAAAMVTIGIAAAIFNWSDQIKAGFVSLMPEKQLLVEKQVTIKMKDRYESERKLLDDAMIDEALRAVNFMPTTADVCFPKKAKYLSEVAVLKCCQFIRPGYTFMREDGEFDERRECLKRVIENGIASAERYSTF